ncbi:MAG: hypothetical protein A2Z15_06490 [Chloroflexi bacterium RBG_16_50_11]|nr:MAG: hypothetical protein A2Z15_06490 [Chloroflexi bacterium RBG_16_50_11]
MAKMFSPQKHEKDKRSQVEYEVIQYLTKHDFNKASLAIAGYEAGQVFSRGVGIDWKNHNPDNDIALLKTIFGRTPKILIHLGNEKLEAVRIAAAMMELWGVNRAKKWLPTDFKTDLPFDNDTTARMLLFFAQHQAALERYRNEGLKYVEVLPTSDSCEACKKLADKHYILKDAPELPSEHCTHKMGCRCTFLPVV